MLRELEGLSYREIGERLNLSRRRSRARCSAPAGGCEEYDELATGARCVRVQR